MNKEELLKQNAVFQKEKENWSSANKRRREEFAKAFSFYKPHSGYGNEKLLEDISWEQIFVEIGKLLAARTFYDLEGNVSELECKLNDTISRIKKNEDSVASNKQLSEG